MSSSKKEGGGEVLITQAGGEGGGEQGPACAQTRELPSMSVRREGQVCRPSVPQTHSHTWTAAA